MNVSTAVVHRLPLNTTFRGTSDVHLFAQSIEPTSADQPFITRLRGRRLVGRTVTVPPGFGGVVLRRHSASRDTEAASPLIKKSRDEASATPGAPTRRSSSTLADFDLTPLAAAAPLSPTAGGNARPSAAERDIPAAAFEVLKCVDFFVAWEHDREPDTSQIQFMRNWAELSQLLHPVHAIALTPPVESS